MSSIFQSIQINCSVKGISRFVWLDSRTRKFWNGNVPAKGGDLNYVEGVSPWTPHKNQALLFYDVHSGGRELDVIAEHEFGEPRVYHLTLEVKVYADRDLIPFQKVVSYLNKALNVSLNYREFGMSPIPNSVATVSVDTYNIKVLK